MRPSTTARIAAELQYASRELLSSAVKKLEMVHRRILSSVVEVVYAKLKAIDTDINRTDIYRLFASMGAQLALRDPESTRTS